MATVTLKNVPEDLLGRLRSMAAEERRSLNQQILYLLDSALRAEADVEKLQADAARQATAWRRLAGRWVSRESPEEEKAKIYGSRTEGRAIEP